MSEETQASISPKDKIEITIPVLEEGEGRKLVNVGGNYILAELSSTNQYECSDNYVQQATYDSEKLTHTYSKMIEKESSSYVTTPEKLSSLAQNTQSNINKIIEVNGIVKYYVNKEDLIGRVVETIENNINTNYSVNYPSIPNAKKKEQKMFTEMKLVIDKFNKQINIPKLIADNVISTYIEGNFIYYLMGDYKNGYSIVDYPLDMTEITPMKIDNDPIISFNVTELSSRLQQARTKYSTLKSNKLFDIQKILDDEVKRDYPTEIYDAYKLRDTIALLNPQRVGLSRINNLKGRYGLTPVFKSLSSQLMLETLDNVDRKVIIGKAKKVFFQSTRKELMGADFSKPMQINPVGYAHTSLLQAMSNDIVVYTSMPFVENLSILEPEADLADEKTRLSYRIRVMESLGISFISSQGSNSITTTKINYNELLKTINKITKQLEPVINKFYQLVCEENGFPIEFAPKISIQSTDLLDLETKLMLVETLYSKIGVSYETTFDMLGMDYESEVSKRIAENDYEVNGVKMTMDDIMSPHANSFVISGKEGDTVTHNNPKADTVNGNGSKKSENVDKTQSDKARQESL